ncbi:MAG: hypothetical protein KIT72_19950 [Polyangiaceae bacterium]|nr:hypothetical protein [Polyangiaceae bacterium]MCW5792696.1 hypothetical protein [Polyangiaceae bacterium]
MSTSPVWPRSAWLLLAASFTFGCKPEVGSRCEVGESRCLDEKTQLICSEGRMIAAPCRGEKGCWVEEGVRCDLRGNQAGDACSRDEQGASTCSADGRAQLVCFEGAFVAEPCRGPAGCTLEEPCGPGGCAARCDRAVAQAGDRCRDTGLKACNLAGTQLLSCQDGQMKVELHCRGSKGCSTSGGQLSCDLARAAADDPCPKDMEGKHACSADQLGIVTCRAARFALSESCAKGELCDDSDGKIRCARTDK